MANNDIGNLVAGLMLDDAKFLTDLKTAGNKVDSFAAKSNKSLALMERGWKKVVKSVGGFAGVTAGASAAAVGFVYLTKKNLEAADSIGKTADRIGITTGALQEYRFMAERAGVDTSVLDNGLGAFTKRLGEAKMGTGSLNGFLKKYDESLLEAVKSTSSTDEALRLIIDRMAGMSDASDKAALAAAAFSRTAGVKLTTMVKGGSEAVQQLRDDFQRFGIEIDESLIRNAEGAQDALLALDRVMGSAGSTITLSLAPAITQVANDLAGWIADNQEFIRQDLPKIIDQTAMSIVEAGKAIKYVIDLVPGDKFAAIGSFIENMVPSNKILATYVKWQLAQEKINSSTENATEAIKKQSGALDKHSTATGKSIKGLDNFRKALDKINTTESKNLEKTLKKQIDQGKESSALLKQLKESNIQYTQDVGVLMQKLQESVDNGLGAQIEYQKLLPETAGAAKDAISKINEEAEKLIETTSSMPDEIGGSFDDMEDDFKATTNSMQDEWRGMISSMEDDSEHAKIWDNMGEFTTPDGSKTNSIDNLGAYTTIETPYGKSTVSLGVDSTTDWAAFEKGAQDYRATKYGINTGSPSPNGGNNYGPEWLYATEPIEESAEAVADAADTAADAAAELAAAEQELTDAREQAQSSIESLINNLQGSSDAPVQSMAFFENRYDQLLSDAIAASGTAEYGDKVKNLTGFIPSMLDFASGYGGDYASMYNSVMGDLNSLSAGDISSNATTVDDSSGTPAGDTTAGSTTDNGGLTVVNNISIGDREIKDFISETIATDPNTINMIERAS